MLSWFSPFFPNQLQGKSEGESGGLFHSVKFSGYLLNVHFESNTVLAKYIDL